MSRSARRLPGCAIPVMFVLFAVVVVSIGAAMRFHNAFAFPIQYGFDALPNWEYIHQLMGSWRLPDPSEGWSTAHPPFFYYAAAALGRSLGSPDQRTLSIAVRLANTIMGLGAIGGIALLVLRCDPGNRRRAVLAAGLVLFLPVHIYVTAMLGEELLVSSLMTVVLVGVGLELARPSQAPLALWRPALLGLVAGLAFLTKLTGILIIASVVAAYALDGLRRRRLKRAIVIAVLFALVAGVVGGWPYARNWVRHGYWYPHDVPVHSVMHSMPPGERGVIDYVRVPLATWTDPRAVAPDLLHSVWGTTYATIWFDAHRHFLPRWGTGTTSMGTTILLLALLPSLAFAVGLSRGVRRAWNSPVGPDSLLLIFSAATLAGYVLFTWMNPWYATLKGSYLLGLCLPFAYYASEVLEEWTRAIGSRTTAVSTLLVCLMLCVSLSFSFGVIFPKKEGPGFKWERVESR